jgi:group II intron reverse transcriptase/maturase
MAGGGGEAFAATSATGRPGNGEELMELIVARSNMKRALTRVKSNGGSAGVDGMSVQDLVRHVVRHWEAIREQLLAGTYQPQPVRRASIPKPGGGVRELGIPTVLDRLIQQAILQVLQPRIDPTFSEHSYGFRPGRSARDAVEQARRHIQDGYTWVVDVDLEKFFDRVNHDVLMGRLAKRIGDRRLLVLIRRYLAAGVLAAGLALERHEGTPQGGPLSPLLANVLLDDVDKELERRGHRFVRYADDCNVYVQSKRAGERVLAGLRRLYGRLRLQVNEAKSAVARAVTRSFLGFSFWVSAGRIVRRRVAPAALAAMKQRVRQITDRNGGRSLSAVIEELSVYLRGWREYFRQSETPGIFEDLDKWIRRRLRVVQLKQWKRGRTAFRELVRRGVPAELAARASAQLKQWWFTTKHPAVNMAFPTAYFDGLSLPRLAG